MIHPAPTTPIDPTVARGVLEDFVPETPGVPHPPLGVVLSFPNSSYRMHLVLDQASSDQQRSSLHIGRRAVGVIRAKARRVDIVDTGGKYVEPVYGHPRRVQGRVVAIDIDNREIVVDAGMPIRCLLTDARQQAVDFPLGALVSFDVLDGTTFTPTSTQAARAAGASS